MGDVNKKKLIAVSHRIRIAMKNLLKQGLNHILVQQGLFNSKILNIGERRDGVDYKDAPQITIDYLNREFNPVHYHYDRPIVRPVEASKAKAVFAYGSEKEGYLQQMVYKHPMPYTYYYIVAVWSHHHNAAEAEAIVEAIQHPSVLPERGYVPVTLSDGNVYNWNMFCGDVSKIDPRKMLSQRAPEDFTSEEYRVELMYTVEGFNDPFLYGERQATISRTVLEMERLDGVETEEHLIEPIE